MHFYFNSSYYSWAPDRKSLTANKFVSWFPITHINKTFYMTSLFQMLVKHLQKLQCVRGQPASLN